MGLNQLFADENRLRENNSTIKSLAAGVTGAAAKRIGKDGDTGTAVYALAVGTLRIELDYLNTEGEGYSLTVTQFGKFVGGKRCSTYTHLLNTVKKLAGMTSEQVAEYLAPITMTTPTDPKAHYTKTGEWKGWRDFLAVPSDSPICDDCGTHPCECDKS